MTKKGDKKSQMKIIIAEGIYNSLIFEGLSKDRGVYIEKIKSGLGEDDISSITKMLKKLKIMPVGKQRHSMRVSSNLVDLGVVDRDVVLGALFHDYIERGGDIDSLDISTTSKDMIKFLSVFDNQTSDTDNAPLEHLVSVFGNISNESLKNQLVMIKVSDRIDNLKRREKSVSKRYLNKSIDMIKFLMGNYTGSVDLKSLLMILHKKLHKKISKRI